MAVRPLASVKVLGKKRTGGPFKIIGNRGNYYYTSAKTAEKLLEVNEAYRALRKGKGKVKPLSKPKIVGRGGALGFKPFLMGGERYLCILAEDLERLWAVNEAYRELLKKKRAKAKAKK